MTGSVRRDDRCDTITHPGVAASFSSSPRHGSGFIEAKRFLEPNAQYRVRRRTLRGLPLLSPPVDDYDPGRGIILHFSTHTVKIAGRNLKALYAELLELKLRHIVVVAEEHDLEGPEAVVVHRVGVKQDDGTTRGGLDQPEQRSR